MESVPLHVWTPTIESLPLQKHTGKKIWLKMECYQPVGSFKIRGIGRLCQYYASQGKKHFVSASGGNAGLAAAYAGRKLGIKVTVFLPNTSKKIFIDAIQAQMAQTKIAGADIDQAHKAAVNFAEEIGGAYIPPFNHPLIWAGHSTMISEIANEGIKPDAVVVAVGGGGLACGILEGMHQYGWYDVPLFAVETEGAASFAAAVEANQLVSLPEIKTIATSLGAKQVAKKLFDWRNAHSIYSLTVTDQAAIAACYSFLDDHRLLLEPSSATALSVIYDLRQELKNYESILIIVCGGVGITLSLLNEFRNEV
jgi:L-serine/L-threonine ammonia-lyase